MSIPVVDSLAFGLCPSCFKVFNPGGFLISMNSDGSYKEPDQPSLCFQCFEKLHPRVEK